MEHWRMNLRVAGEGTGAILEGRVVPLEGSPNASFVRIVRTRWEKIEAGEGHLSLEGGSGAAGH